MDLVAQVRAVLRNSIGRAPSTVECERLAQYVALLHHWNRRIRLVGTRNRDEIVRRHLPECAAAVEPHPGERVIDVGAGNGLPGLVLAVLYPGARFTLVESVAKKVAFLRAAVLDVAIGNVEIVRGRAEELIGRDFDVAIARAVLPVPEWLALGVRLVRPGGRVVAMTRAPVAPTAIPAGLRATRAFDSGRPGLEFVRA